MCSVHDEKCHRVTKTLRLNSRDEILWPRYPRNHRRQPHPLKATMKGKIR